MRRVKLKTDARVRQVAATAKGKRLLQAGRRRIERLAADLAGLSCAEREMLADATELLEKLSGAPRTR